MKAKVNLSWITFIVIAQFVILLISSCIIGITSFYSKRDSISEMLKANTNQVAELLGKDLNSIYTIADNSYLNISVQQALQRDNAQESSVYEKYCTHQLLESLSTSHPAISDMIIYPLIGEPYHIQNDIVGIQNCYELREKKWFKQISKLESGFTLLPEENGLIIKGIERPYVIFMKPKYDTFLSLETRGRLTDLTGEIYLDNYQSENLKIYEVNKCQYAIPFISNKLVACYNLSVLEKLNYEIPKNAQDLEKIFREALRREITPIIFGGEDEKGFYEMYIQWLMLVLRNFNQTSFFANDLQNGKVRADDPVLLEYMELIYNLSQKGYFSNKNLLINTAEAMDAFESDKAVVIMSDIWSLYQQLGDDFEKKYMPGSLVVEEGEANEINSLSFILGIDSKSDAKENANLLIEFLSTDVNEDDIELPEGMHLLNTEADENSLYKKEYDYEVYMDKCAWWIKEPFKDMTARLLSDQKIEDVIASTEELFESLTIPTYIYVP